MLLAGDVGGTKTLLGLFERNAHRPQPIEVSSFVTNEYASFGEMLDAFVHKVGRPMPIEAAVAGVAGPVIGGTATLTNVEWDVSAADMTVRLGTPRVRLLNDLEALAISANVLAADELVVLQHGVPRADGNAAVIAAGTGLGEAFLHRVQGRLRPVPSEGGHADFAARTDREIELVRALRERFGRAEVEHVLSGPGLRNLHRFTHAGTECHAIDGLSEFDVPAAISRAALSGTCENCVEALSLFVSAYGAEAGNHALRGLATAGLFIGGGIAPKILPALEDGRFMRAFLDKGPMADLAEKIPVRVITNPEAGLLGAAVFAQELARP